VAWGLDITDLKVDFYRGRPPELVGSHADTSQGIRCAACCPEAFRPPTAFNHIEPLCHGEVKCRCSRSLTWKVVGQQANPATVQAFRPLERLYFTAIVRGQIFFLIFQKSTGKSFEDIVGVFTLQYMLKNMSHHFRQQTIYSGKSLVNFLYHV
jgi:hypothetical protein